MSSIDEIILRQVELVLMEDIGPGDITTLACVKPTSAGAEIIAKSDGVLAGLPIVEAAFRKLDDKAAIKAVKKDGDSFKKGDRVVEIRADSRAILTAERSALNFLGHLSGIATLTSRFVKAVKGTGTKILDTRKTTPGLRYLEKYAVTCGGGVNHRFGLFDMALIKDNHITACGSVSRAVEKMRIYLDSEEFKQQFVSKPEDVIIEVEVVNEEQLAEAIEAGVKRLLLDNRSIEQLARLVQTARGLAKDVLLEASGNVNLENVRPIAETGVDFISIGALTHSAPSADFSLKFISRNG
jgi:nicotinate-nucleotide pyrophosphorylase (carboxylating)